MSQDPWQFRAPDDRAGDMGAAGSGTPNPPETPHPAEAGPGAGGGFGASTGSRFQPGAGSESEADLEVEPPAHLPAEPAVEPAMEPPAEPAGQTVPRAGQTPDVASKVGPEAATMAGSAARQHSPAAAASPFPSRRVVVDNAVFQDPPVVGPQKRKGPGWTGLIVGMVITGLVSVSAVLGLVGAQSFLGANGADLSPEGFGQSGPTEDVEVVDPVPVAPGGPDWQAVAAAVSPATVSIMVDGTSEGATGSGVVYDAAGHIVTNHHVVAPAIDGGSITVTTNDSRMFSAEVVGTDPTTDLAVLLLTDPPADLVAARAGNSAELRVGEPVMAIGSPLGLADTVTTGVISALDRPVVVQSTSNGVGGEAETVVTNAIQIDASINPGNSGGPLFDETGAVIGINSSIASVGSNVSEMGSIGLGFAIPVDLASAVVTQIIETGSVRHALLGVEIRTGAAQTEELARLGAEVAAVSSGGAADQAGLQVGDVIIGIEGRSVVSGPALTGYVRRHGAGDEVTLEVVRDGQVLQVPVVLQER